METGEPGSRLEQQTDQESSDNHDTDGNRQERHLVGAAQGNTTR